MASRKAVTTIEKEVKEKQPKKSAKKVVDSLDSNVETYEQISLDKSKLAWELKFLRPNEVVEIISYEGEFTIII